MDKQLLDILVCPATGAALRRLEPGERESLNARIQAGTARYADGTSVTEPLTAGLITVDERSVYRVDDDIPVMLPGRGIVCD